MKNRPEIFVAGKEFNMQSWYEEKSRRALVWLAKLSDVVHRQDEEKINGCECKKEEMEHLLYNAVRNVLAVSVVSCGQKDNIDLKDIDLIVDKGYEGYKAVAERVFGGEGEV